MRNLHLQRMLRPQLCAEVGNSRIESTGNKLVAILIYETAVIGSDESTACMLCQANARMQAKPNEYNRPPATAGHPAHSGVRR